MTVPPAEQSDRMPEGWRVLVEHPDREPIILDFPSEQTAREDAEWRRQVMSPVVAVRLQRRPPVTLPAWETVT